MLQMLDSVEGPVHHLAYERGEDVIVMKGYKFAKAKTAAAAILGCLALANPTVAAYLVQVPYPATPTPCLHTLQTPAAAALSMNAMPPLFPSHLSPVLIDIGPCH